MSVLKLFSPAQGRSNQSLPIQCTTVTVRQVLDWYESSPRANKSPVGEAERRRIWGLLKSHMGDRATIDCKPVDLMTFINHQDNLKSDWSRKRWNATCQRPFNFAERLQLIPKNPFRGLSFPEGDEGRDWTDEEYAKILRWAAPPFRCFVVALRYSGLRPGEARELEWGHIRIEDGAIVIEKHKTRYKTKKPRYVPLNDVLVKMFLLLRRRNPTAKFVFLNSKGRPWTRSMADRTLSRIREKAGLPDDVKLHGARHTFATRALMNGVQVASLAEILGHAKFTTTQRYVHMANKVDHLAESMRKAVQKKPKAKREDGSQSEKSPKALGDVE